MPKLTKHLLERNALRIAIFFTIIVAFLSLISISGFSLGLRLNRVENSDKLGHIIAYFVLSLSWFYALKFDLKSSKQKLLFILILISYGIILEVLQESITTYRTGDFKDILANSFGVFVAAISFKKLNYWFNSLLK